LLAVKRRQGPPSTLTLRPSGHNSQFVLARHSPFTYHMLSQRPIRFLFHPREPLLVDFAGTWVLGVLLSRRAVHPFFHPCDKSPSPPAPIPIKGPLVQTYSWPADIVLSSLFSSLFVSDTPSTRRGRVRWFPKHSSPFVNSGIAVVNPSRRRE